ncbi:MAG: DUF2934 domain-containing protein [Candidatus Tritonobacter lacicola]|nr:DUF2934 domain-containing protein [Candidatus Tritonobacter lacicola]
MAKTIRKKAKTTTARTRKTLTRVKSSAKRALKKAAPATQVCVAERKLQETPRFRLSPEHYRRVVQENAYYLWERRGRTHGRHFGDWVHAERIVKSRISNN